MRRHTTSTSKTSSSTASGRRKTGASPRMSGSRRAGVLGHPIAHSLSPLLHRAAYGELGLDWEYDAHDVTEDGLPAFLAGVDDDWAGLSLTMPLKVAVLPHLN